jgi:D-glycero-alpha-D-manno-heptose-7-phosphate kinase
MMIVARAPTRIDFGGGWTDVPPYADEVGGFVCNIAIARYATARLSSREGIDGVRPIREGTVADQAIAAAASRRLGVSGVQIDLQNDFPVGAGLGGSSAAEVAVLAALAAHSHTSLAMQTIAELSRAIEVEDLGVAGGRQDHYAAVFGGALALRFSSRGVDVERIPLTADFRKRLERCCLIIYTGQSRISGDTISAVLDAYRGGATRVLVSLRRMGELAEQMARAVASADFASLASLVGEQWVHQRALHPAIPTPLIDTIIDHARRAGASGAKALGASGGGCVLVLASEERVAEVRAAIAPLGELLPFTIDEQGVTQCL